MWKALREKAMICKLGREASLEKVTIYKQKESPRTMLAPDLGLLASRTVRFLLCKSSSVWYFVMAALAKITFSTSCRSNFQVPDWPLCLHILLPSLTHLIQGPKHFFSCSGFLLLVVTYLLLHRHTTLLIFDFNQFLWILWIIPLRCPFRRSASISLTSSLRRKRTAI